MVVRRTGSAGVGGRRWLVLLVVVTALALTVVVVRHRPASSSAATPAAASIPASPLLSTPATSSPTPSPTTQTPGPLHVVGLGDSVTSGEHCDCDDYVTGFGKLLSRRDGVEVRTVNDGESGSTSADLADDLAHDDDLRSDVRAADVAVVTIGANDLSPGLRRWRAGSCAKSCYAPLVAAMSSHLDQVLGRLSGLGLDPSRVLVTTYWNVFTDGDVAEQQEDRGYLAWSDTVTRAANTAICASAVRAGDRCVDLYTPFKGDGGDDPTTLLAADGDHPNTAGTALISRTVLAALERTS